MVGTSHSVQWRELKKAQVNYITKHQVWSNFNAQYTKHQKILDNVKWFQPSLGWSSGPTALRLACDREFKEIYMLGFDYTGYQDAKSSNRHRFNNIFKDTRNYKKSTDEATFYGNWMNQTKRCLQDFKNTNFYRVTPTRGFRPKDLEWSDGLKHINTEDFLSKFNLQIKI